MTREDVVSDDQQYGRQVLLDRLQRAQEKIDRAVERRPGRAGVELVAVSKTHPVEAMEVLYEAGVRSFGSSYVQEWQEKVDSLPDDIRWHFIGRLQSNKAKYVANRVAMVHSVDRKSLAKKLHRRLEEPVDVLLQVNLGLEDSKGGVAEEDLVGLMELVAGYPKLRIRGLMGMPPYSADPEHSRPYFRRLRQALNSLREVAQKRFPGRAEELTELSMGMSNDYEVAIEEGATIVRLGTALFGRRSYEH